MSARPIKRSASSGGAPAGRSALQALDRDVVPDGRAEHGLVRGDGSVGDLALERCLLELDARRGEVGLERRARVDALRGRRLERLEASELLVRERRLRPRGEEVSEPLVDPGEELTPGEVEADPREVGVGEGLLARRLDPAPGRERLAHAEEVLEPVRGDPAADGQIGPGVGEDRVREKARLTRPRDRDERRVLRGEDVRVRRERIRAEVVEVVAGARERRRTGEPSLGAIGGFGGPAGLVSGVAHPAATHSTTRDRARRMTKDRFAANPSLSRCESRRERERRRMTEAAGDAIVGDMARLKVVGWGLAALAGLGLGSILLQRGAPGPVALSVAGTPAAAPHATGPATATSSLETTSAPRHAASATRRITRAGPLTRTAA